ncbi:MAG TPA: hypothetical protein VH331_01445 [Allosphingosinicella sp.]|jgi:membrane protease YdiL (CAAX protease family)|nr:hypothetical protein [Allosphingosinicella sp.]
MAGKSTPLPGRPPWLGFLPDFLFDVDRRPERYILKAWLLALGPSILLSIVVNLIFHPQTQPDLRLHGIGDILLIVVASPVIETFILALVLAGLTRLFSAGPAAAASAVLWGLAHSSAAPVWGLVVWWPFLVMSIAWLTWLHAGFLRAIFVTVSIHALQNCFGVLIAVLFGHT